MIKVENIDVWGFEHAVHGCRNPMNSWAKSDSFQCDRNNCRMKDCPRYTDNGEGCDHIGEYIIGENDLDLMRRLYKAGTEHRTYARMIYATMDITAPLYWHKENDRYTIGKSQVSCSTMHKIHAKEFELDDFSHEHLNNAGRAVLECVIEQLNADRSAYIATKDKDYWWNMIQTLPSSYNQRRTVSMSYEVIFKIIRERTGHRLDEWNFLVEVLKGLPYVERIMGE